MKRRGNRHHVVTGLLAAGAALVAMLLAEPPGAHADPVDTYTAINGQKVCVVLTASPDLTGVRILVNAMVNDGLSRYQAGQVIAQSSYLYCPEHLPMLRRIANAYGATRDSERTV